jgi:hypothetical protein
VTNTWISTVAWFPDVSVAFAWMRCAPIATLRVFHLQLSTVAEVLQR